MDSDELEKFFNKRFQTILYQHIKLVMNEKGLTSEAKQRQLDVVIDMMDVLNNHIQNNKEQIKRM